MHRRTVTTLTAGAVVVAMFGLGLSSCTPPPLEGVTAYEGATVIVGDGSAPIENATIVVDHDKISLVGAASDVEVPAGAARVDVSGKTIMPTLVDTHTHVRQSPEELIQDLKRRAYFGVSATLALGTDSAQIVGMRAQAIPAAARFFSAGLGITAPEGGRSFAPFTGPYHITTAEEGREAVREQAALGVDMIKIWVDDRDGRYAKLTPDLYGPIIEEAHANNLRVTAHIYDLSDAKGLLDANVDSYAHSIRDMDVDDEVMEMFPNHPDFVLIPNLSSRGAPTDLGWLQSIVPDEEFEGIQRGNVDNPEVNERFQIQARNLVAMNDAGVKITMGTDGNRPWGAHVEMEDMVIAGMSPMDVIVSSTGDAAKFLGLEDTGTLTVGMNADFLVLDGNPLEDINNTRKISQVFLNGEAIDRTAYP